MAVTSFDDLISKVFDKVDKALVECNFAQARYWYDRGCNLYSRHPTENKSIETRKEDLYRILFER